MSDEDNNNREVIIKPSQEELLAAFNAMWKGWEFQENVAEDGFQSLQKCEYFYENYVLYNKPVQGGITDSFRNSLKWKVRFNLCFFLSF